MVRVYTCFNNDGSELLSTDKYIWSQGRFLYILAKLKDMNSKKYLKLNELSIIEVAAHKTANFLLKNIILDDYSCCYLSDSQRNKKEPTLGSGFHTSFYVDCFIILGLSEYCKVYPNSEILKVVFKMKNSILERFKKQLLLSEPYQSFAFSMILLNICNVLYHCCTTLEHSKTDEVLEDIRYFFDDLNKNFFLENGRSIELLPKHKTRLQDTLLYNHSALGHTTECLWFVYDSIKILNLDLNSELV